MRSTCKTRPWPLAVAVVLGLAVLAKLPRQAAAQDRPPASIPGPSPELKPPPGPKEAPGVDWAEGRTIPVRVPVSSPGQEFMTTLAFPEESIETAITGWTDGEITAKDKRGLLFLRLTKSSQGQMNVIGSSGTHYLLFLRGIEHPEPGTYDEYLKIRRAADPRAISALPKRREARPGGAVELLQAMRLGLPSDGVRILRAARELAYESPALEIRLLYVYDAPAYQGLIYEVKNLSRERQAVDASRLRGLGNALILSALRENVLAPGLTTRLYTLTWKD